MNTEKNTSVFQFLECVVIYLQYIYTKIEWLVHVS